MDANNELLQAIGQMMDSKLAAALEPIKADIADLKQGQAATNNRLDSVEETLQTVRTSQLKVELEQYPRIAAALDGVLAGIEKNKAQDERITALESKADRHDTRLWALEQKAI